MVGGFLGAITAVTWKSQCECPPSQQCISKVKRLHLEQLLHLGP